MLPGMIKHRKPQVAGPAWGSILRAPKNTNGTANKNPAAR